jgi:hypothetical protein
MLVVISLVAWFLIIYGYHEGELYLAEAVIMGLLWALTLCSVLYFGVSIWGFYIPTAAITTYGIIRVLGADAKAFHP